MNLYVNDVGTPNLVPIKLWAPTGRIMEHCCNEPDWTARLQSHVLRLREVVSLKMDPRWPSTHWLTRDRPQDNCALKFNVGIRSRMDAVRPSTWLDSLKEAALPLDMLTFQSYNLLLHASWVMDMTNSCDMNDAGTQSLVPITPPIDWSEERKALANVFWLFAQLTLILKAWIEV